MGDRAAASLAERVEALERLAAAMLRPDGHAVGCSHLDRDDDPSVPCDHEPICEALRAFAAKREGRAD